jgi:hypothetical protein
MEKLSAKPPDLFRSGKTCLPKKMFWTVAFKRITMMTLMVRKMKKRSMRMKSTRMKKAKTSGLKLAFQGSLIGTTLSLKTLHLILREILQMTPENKSNISSNNTKELQSTCR